MSVQVWSDIAVGPASYTTGGFTVATGLSTITFANCEVSISGANLPHHHVVITRNSPSAGSFTVKIVTWTMDKLTSFGALASLPAGVTEAATSGQSYDADAAHVHSMAHDHAAVTSGTNNLTGGGTTLQPVGPQAISSHTHSFDPPNFTGNTGVGTSHAHTWNNIYQHSHNVTLTTTDFSTAELTAGTDLSGATLIFKAVGPV